MEDCPGNLVHLVNSASKRCPQALPSRSHQILTPFRPYTLPHRSPPSRSSLVIAVVLSPVSSPGPPEPPVSFPVSSPPDSVAIRRFSTSRPHHLFNMAEVDCIRTFVRIHHHTGRRRLVPQQPSPPSCCRSRPRDRRSRPRWTLSPPAASLVVPTISSTFSSKSAIAKFRNARQTKMANVDSNIQHRYVTLTNHCT